MTGDHLFGAHVSVAGGISNAPGNGRESGCDVIQVFTRYPTRWVTPPIPSEEVEAYFSAMDEMGVHTVASHGSYLINLASGSLELYERSIEALRDELQRAMGLKIRNVVIHPGSAGSEAEAEGIDRVARAVTMATAEYPGIDLCLETTAGQGTSLGYRLSQLKDIIEGAGSPLNACICLDSCHLFAAGYDIGSSKGFSDFTNELGDLGLTDKVRIIHLNDSKRELGSRVDRHTHIGEGMIGIMGFRNLINFPAFREVPFIIETPKEGEAGEMDRRNLERLRKLA
jgi:deoxyribonuclease-4